MSTGADGPRQSGRLRQGLSYALRYFPSLLTFVAGTGALVLADAIIARYAPSQDIERWVALKALTLVGGAIAVTGLDQVILREPDQAKRLLRWGSLNAAVLAVAAAFVAHSTGYYSGAAAAFLGIFGVALSYLIFALLRTRLRLTQSQVARDGWKLAFALLLPVYFWAGLPLEWVLVAAFLIGLPLALLPGTAAGRDELRQVHREVAGYSSAMRVGLPFLLSGTAFAIAAYGELLLVRAFGSTADVENYFRAVILFSYPSVMLNAYLGATLAPAIRQAPERSSKMLRSSARWLVPATLLLPVAALLLGRAAEPFMFPGSATPLWLAALLSATAGLRFLYIAVSSFVGSLATATQLRAIMSAYFVAAIATIPICAALLTAGIGVPAAVAVTALLHWLFRTTIGWGLTARITKHYAGARSEP